VRAVAVWALSRLGEGAEFAALKARHLPDEPDAQVREEWLAAECVA
jgi:epoxyqueuosine reductase